MVEVKGQKGSSSSSSSTSEDPNTLTSRQFFRVIDWIGFGQNGGLRGDDIRKSAILNGTAVMNPDGSINHEGVEIEQRFGLPDQEYVSGFSDGVSSEISVGIEVRKDSPVVRTITNLTCDAVRVTIRFPQVTRVDGSSVKGSVVDWAIDVKPSDGAWYEADRNTVDGKTTSEFPRDRRVKLNGTGPWNIRVRRISDDSTSTSRIDAFTWYSYTEITEGKFTWPNIAYVALKIDAKLFGTSLPTRVYDWEPTLVQVPSNYDPVTHEYSSTFWDGSFKLAATENPIWHAYDVVTNDMNGVSCDKFEVYSLAKYCDEMISDGLGGTRPRFTINTVLTERKAAIEWLSDIMSVCRGMFYWDGAAIKFLLDQPAPIERYLLPENVSEEGFKVQCASIDARYTVCNVTFNDPDNMFSATVETVIDHDGVRKYGWVSKDVTAIGCTNRAQAHMYGKWVLYCDLNETHRLTFKPTIDNADLRPGMVIAVTDAKRAGVRLGGRIKAYDAGVVTVDKLPDEKVSSGQDWNLAIRTEKGEWETVPVSKIDAANNTITLEKNLTSTPVDFAPWVMIGSKISPEQWKVISISEDEGEFEVNCVEHHPGKYALVEEGVYLDEGSHTSYKTGALEPPTGLSMLASTVVDGTQETQRLTLSWTPSSDSRTDHYTVSVKRPDSSSYETLTQTTMCTVDIDNAESGKWSFRVAALSNLGTSSPWATYTSEVSNLLLPVMPDSVSTTVGNRSITLSAFKSSNVGQTFEFWVSDVELQGNIESNARHFADGDSVALTGLSPDHDYYFYVRGTNTHGVSGWYPLQAKTTNVFSEEYDYVVSEIEKEGGPLSKIQQSAKDTALAEAQRVVPEEVAKASEQFNTALADFKNLSFTPLADKVDKQGEAFQTLQESINADQYAQNQQIAVVQAAAAAAHAGVSTEQYVRATADEAISVRVDTVSATLSNVDSRVTEETKARATADEALAGKVTTVQANIDKEATDRQAQVQQEALARQSGDEAVAGQVNTLSARVDTTDASIRDEAQARVSGDEALSSRLTQMGSDYDGKISTVTNSVSTLSNSVQAVAQDNTQLKAQVGDAVSEMNDQKRSDAAEQYAQNVWLTVQRAHTATASAGVSTEILTRASDVAAMGQVVTGVSAAVNDLSATVKTDMKAEVDKITGMMNSQYTISAVTSNGKTAAVGLTNNGVTTDFGVIANRFWVGDDSSGSIEYPFIIDSGRVMMKEAMISKVTVSKLVSDDGRSAIEDGKIRADLVSASKIVSPNKGANGRPTINIDGETSTFELNAASGGGITLNSGSQLIEISDGSSWVFRAGKLS